MTILGVHIDGFRREEVLQQLERPQVIFTPNPEILLQAASRPRLRTALSKGTLMLPDGHGLQVVSTLLQVQSRFLRVLLYFPALLLFLFWKKPFARIFPEVIHGSDFMDEVIHFAVARDWPVFFLGGRGTVAQKTADFFKAKYPRLRVAGASPRDPSREAFELVKAAHAQVLLVAYGAPKQELWIAEYASQIPRLKTVMAVGGSFDFYSGAVKRAPRLLRVLGLEWLWRLILNPIQRGQRIWNAVVAFPLKALLKN